MTAENSEISISQRIWLAANTIFHSILAIVTFFIFWVVFRHNEINKTVWHIFYSSIAYIPLMAEGILLFADSNTWTQYILRTNKYIIHGILLGPSVILLTVGCVIIINEKNQYNAKHFQTDHAITGLASWILCLASVLLGLFAFYSQKLKSFIPPVYLKFAHNFFGMSAYLIGMASFILGLDKRNFSNYVAAEELTWTKWLLIIVTVYSVLEACRSLFNQVKSMFS